MTESTAFVTTAAATELPLREIVRREDARFDHIANILDHSGEICHPARNRRLSVTTAPLSSSDERARVPVKWIRICRSASRQQLCR